MDATVPLPERRTRCRDGQIATVATAAVLTMLVGACVVAWTTSWSPVSDWALLELQVRAVGGAHTPLVGTYSRFGWSHPGPWPIWLLAVPYRLSGSSSNGLLVGAVLLHAAVVVGIARVAWRRGGLLLTLITLGALSLLLRSLGVGLLIDPWNPWLAAAAVAWFLFLAWDLAAGHRWSLPMAAAVGSLAVQAHVGVTLVVAVVGAAAVLLVARGAGRQLEAAEGPPWSRAVVVTIAVAVAAWAPSLVEQVTSSPGNARQILSFFLGHGGERATTFFGSPAHPTGWHEGLSVLARETVGWAPWLGGSEPRTMLGGVAGRSPLSLAVPVVLVVLAVVVGRRLEHAELLAAGVVGGSAIAAAAISVARIVDEPFDYLVRWMWPVALFVHVVALWAVVLAVRSRREAAAPVPGVRRWVASAAVVAVLAVVATSFVSGAHDEAPRSNFASAVEHLVPPTVAWVREQADGPVLVVSDGGLTFVPPALVLALDREGRDVVVDESLATVLPDLRREDAEPAVTVVVAGTAATARLERTPGALRLATDPGVPGADHMPALAVYALNPGRPE